jgi:hypothetical protein
MKYFLTILTLFICISSFEQTYTVNIKDSTLFTPSQAGSTRTRLLVKGRLKMDSLTVYVRDTASWHPRDTATVTIFHTALWYWDGGKWVSLSGFNFLQDGLIQPGYVTWSGTGLIFDVTGAVYILGGALYNSAAGSVTLDAADPTDPRIDVIAVDNTGSIVVIKGDAAANPSIPQIDPATQVLLTSILIPAGATTPEVTQTIIYDENTENYSGTTSGITLNLDNTSNPYHLVKAADVGSWSATRNILFTQNSGTTLASDYSMLKIYIRLKAAIPNTANIRITFLNGTTVVSSVITLNASVGFTKTLAGSYQNVSIPMSAFNFTNNVFNKIRITVAGSGSGMYFDYFQLQGGISPPSSDNPYPVFYGKNTSRDSTILLLSNGTRFSAKDSVGSGSSGTRDTAYLVQGAGIYIANADSTYKPNGFDVSISADTAFLRQYFNNFYSSTTNIVDSGQFRFIVDTISNQSYPYMTSGYKVLVAATGATGDFLNQENNVAELVGATWTFTAPDAGDQLWVSNATQGASAYRFDGANWGLLYVVITQNGNQFGVPVRIGSNDNHELYFLQNGSVAGEFDTDKNLLLPKWANLEDSNTLLTFKEGGRIDTVMAHQFVAGTNITFTPGANRTDTISSTGGGGSQTWQQTLDVGSVLDKDNTVDAANHSFYTHGLNYYETYIDADPLFGTDLVMDNQNIVLSSIDLSNNNSTILSIQPYALNIHSNHSNIPPKVILQSSDSLNVTSPTRIAVWDNDTLKSAAYGGGTPNLEQVTTVGGTTDQYIESSTEIAAAGSLAALTYYSNTDYENAITIQNANDGTDYPMIHSILGSKHIYIKLDNLGGPGTFLGPSTLELPVTGDTSNLSVGVKVNGTTYKSNVNGIADIGTIGGGDSLANLADVTLTSPALNNILTYNSGTSKWVNVVNPSFIGADSGFIPYAKPSAGGFSYRNRLRLDTVNNLLRTQGLVIDSGFVVYRGVNPVNSNVDAMFFTPASTYTGAGSPARGCTSLYFGNGTASSYSFRFASSLELNGSNSSIANPAIINFQSLKLYSVNGSSPSYSNGVIYNNGNGTQTDLVFAASASTITPSDNADSLTVGEMMRIKG